MEEQQDQDESAPLSKGTVAHFDRTRLAPPFFLLLGLASGAALIYLLRGLVANLLLAAILVSLFRPAWQWLSAKLGNRPWLASSLMTLVTVLGILGPITLAVTLAAGSMANLGDSADDFMNQRAAAQYIDRVADGMGVDLSPRQLHDIIHRAQGFLSEFLLAQAPSVAGRIAVAALDLLIVAVCVFYLFVDAGKLKQYLLDLSPLPDDEDELLISRFRDVARGVLVGNGLGSVIQAVLAAIAMAVVGLKGAVLWGIVMTVLAFLPLAGITLVVVPASIVLFVRGDTASALGFLAFCLAEALFVENVVKTRLMGKHTKMHDLLVFLAVLGGIAQFGLMGLLYGPLIAAGCLSLAELYHRVYHQRFVQFLGAR